MGEVRETKASAAESVARAEAAEDALEDQTVQIDLVAVEVEQHRPARATA